MTTVGFGLLVFLGATGTFVTPHDPPVELALLALLMVIGELLPIRISGREDVSEVVTSTTFSFALILSWGIVPALIAQTVASLLADGVRRKPLRRSAFNVAQYTMSLAAAHVVLALASDVPHETVPHFTPADLPAIVLAGIALLVVNSVISGIGLALAEGVAVGPHLREGLSAQLFGDGALLLLAPVVLLVMDVNVWFLLLLLVPLGGVYVLTRENAKLVGRLRHQAERNKHQALHDPLTNLPNRALLHDRVRQATLSAHRDSTTVALMMMDLDRFKEVNDALGHHSGDMLLKQIAQRLTGSLRESDTVARLGGDEFAVLLPDIADPAAAVATAEKLLATLREPFDVQGLTLEIEGSIGIALFPQHADDTSALVQRADVAMYAAKSSHNTWEMYASEQDQYSPGRLALVAELRRAIDREELTLHYQPKAHVDTGRVQGVEALVRWQHPRDGLMPPDEFIPLAEHTGLIRPLTLYVLNAALRQCKKWHERGIDLTVAVNLSAQSLLDLQFPDEVGVLLKKWNVGAPWLKLEITESSIMADPIRAMRVLTKLAGMSIGLSIDDFGTGYTSLAYLRQLPVNEIKIDKSFVMHMSSNENDDVIVHSIIDLGRNLGLDVVAEGVEDRQVLDRLAEFGCDQAQGYYLSRPLPAARLETWIEELNEQSVLMFPPEKSALKR